MGLLKMNKPAAEAGGPEFRLGPHRLLLGDCLPALKDMADDSVDIVMTSPPYNQIGPTRVPKKGAGRFRKAGIVAKLHNSLYEDDLPEDEYQDWLRRVFTECLRVAKGLVWVNHKVRFRGGEGIHPLRFLPFPLYSEVIWDRGLGMAQNCRRFAPGHEALYGFGVPHWWDDRQNKKSAVWRIAPGGGGGSAHPCAFPVQLAARPILASCPPGGVVLDPFAGSATVGVACLKLGRVFLGVEKNPVYYKLACDRLRRRH